MTDLQGVALAALRLADRIGDEFDAIVTGVKKTGTYVRLLSPPQRAE